MPSYRLKGTANRQLLVGTLQPIPGAQVWHVVDNCCAETQGSTSSEQTTDADGGYDMTFTGGNNAHYIRCMIPDAVVATTRFVGLWVTFGVLKEQPLDFLFYEAQAALPAHPCGAKCSTKDTPCERHTTNKLYCYQHKNQDTATV